MIEDLGVDLLLVQESYSHHEHLPPLLYPDACCRCVWEMVEQNRWGSAVYTTTGLVKPVPVPGVHGLGRRGAEISNTSWQAGIADPILAFSIHAPSRKESYQRQVNQLLDEIKKIAGGREVILGGDCNLTVSHWPASQRPVSNQDLAIQARRADEFGLINCWQTANPGQQPHQTLRWTNDRTILYHCDGLFVPKSWTDRLASCVVLAGEEWNRLSDHNPVVACFTRLPA